MMKIASLLFGKFTLFLLLFLLLPGAQMEDVLCSSNCSCSTWKQGQREMVCPALPFLPRLPLSRGSQSQVVKVMLLGRGSKVESIGYHQLYDHHLCNLQRI